MVLNEAISNYPVLSKTEQQKLLEEFFLTKNKKLKDKIILHNLRLVLFLAGKLYYPDSWKDDVIQEGNMGLTISVDKFKPSYNISFTTYASFWVRAYMMRFIMHKTKVIKICTTSTQRDLFFSVPKKQKELINRGIPPTPDLLSKLLKVPESEINIFLNVKSIFQEDYILHTKDPEHANDIWGYASFSKKETDEVEQYSCNKQLYEIFLSLKNTLSKNYIYVFEKRIESIPPMTFKDIGVKLNVTRQRVEQIEKLLLLRLRKRLALSGFNRDDFKCAIAGSDKE
jgi:RNA polymerase sigma-32 factor